jgi:dihydroneopterin triphosphate diphosphatase
MARAPFNVLVYPFRLVRGDTYEFAVFKRADAGWWQGISGGGEDSEPPLEAARRETLEETGSLVATEDFVMLDATEPIPASQFRDGPRWGDNVYVIPQYGFGCRFTDRAIALSGEHTDFVWARYEEADSLIRYNRIPLWELNARLLGGGPRSGPPSP